MSQYYTVCGSTTKTTDCGGENTEADVEEKHEVRCCTDSLDNITGGDNWNKRSGCDVWGESHINGVCHAQKTFAEAVDICSSVGARLCTKDELLADCPRGKSFQCFRLVELLLRFILIHIFFSMVHIIRYGM